MADKITVIACEQDAQNRGYKILLSNGSEAHASRAYEPGEEYVGEPTTDAEPVNETPTEIEGIRAALCRTLDDNATLQRALDEAKKTIDLLQNQAVVDGNTIANLTQQNKDLTAIVSELHQQRNVAPVPDGLIGVTTAKVDNLPSLDQLPAHPTMVPPAAPGEPESQDQRDVREHLERKRAVREAMMDEGTKPQE